MSAISISLEKGGRAATRVPLLMLCLLGLVLIAYFTSSRLADLVWRFWPLRILAVVLLGIHAFLALLPLMQGRGLSSAQALSSSPSISWSSRTAGSRDGNPGSWATCQDCPANVTTSP